MSKRLDKIEEKLTKLISNGIVSPYLAQPRSVDRLDWIEAQLDLLAKQIGYRFDTEWGKTIPHKPILKPIVTTPKKHGRYGTLAEGRSKKK